MPEQEGPDKTIFVVLGMARSGTSVITRGLNALGIPLGNRLAPPNPQWNPSGFFEDHDISHQINHRLLYTLNYAWDSLSIIDETVQTHTRASDIKAQAITLLQQRLQDHPHFAFKDPRTTKILPFWQSVFKELPVQTQYIICLRNPLATAYSYQKLRGFDLATGLSLWLMHLIPAINHTQNHNRLIVHFENMLAQPLPQLARMQIRLNLAGANGEALLHFEKEYLNKQYEHFNTSLAEFKQHPAASVIPLSITVYELLLAAANDEIDSHSAEFMEKWYHIKQEFDRMYPLFIYLDTLLKKNKQAEKNWHTLHKSWLLKLIHPLLWVENTIRTVRRKRREQSKLKIPYAKSM